MHPFSPSPCPQPCTRASCRDLPIQTRAGCGGWAVRSPASSQPQVRPLDRPCPRALDGGWPSAGKRGPGGIEWGGFLGRSSKDSRGRLGMKGASAATLVRWRAIAGPWGLPRGPPSSHLEGTRCSHPSRPPQSDSLGEGGGLIPATAGPLRWDWASLARMLRLGSGDAQ